MKTSQNGIELIKRFEGLRLKAYLCPANVLTIGYGHTGTDVFTGKIISEPEAEQLLRQDLEKFENEVNRLLPKLTQNQFDALVSFAYNVGVGSLQKSTLLKIAKINPCDVAIRKEFARWNKGGGRVLPGLVKRRDAEMELYFKR